MGHLEVVQTAMSCVLEFNREYQKDMGLANPSQAALMEHISKGVYVVKVNACVFQ